MAVFMFCLILLSCLLTASAIHAVPAAGPPLPCYDQDEVERRLEAQMIESQPTPEHSPARHPASQISPSAVDPTYAMINDGAAKSPKSPAMTAQGSQWL